MIVIAVFFISVRFNVLIFFLRMIRRFCFRHRRCILRRSFLCLSYRRHSLMMSGLRMSCCFCRSLMILRSLTICLLCPNLCSLMKECFRYMKIRFLCLWSRLQVCDGWTVMKPMKVCVLQRR